MTEAKLTIGHIARSAGVNIETVRYYQRAHGSDECSIRQFAALEEFADLSQPFQLRLAEEQAATQREIQDLVVLGPRRAGAEAFFAHRAKFFHPV